MMTDDDRCCWTRARERVRVTMNELPASALQSKHAGHADRYRHHFLTASDLGSAALHLRC